MAKSTKEKSRITRTYTIDEDKYIYEKCCKAKAEDMEMKIVYQMLADEFGVTTGAIYQKFHKYNKLAIRGALPFEVDLSIDPVKPEVINDRGIQDISDILAELEPADYLGIPNRINHGFVGVNPDFKVAEDLENNQVIGRIAYVPESKSIMESVTITKETKVEVVQEKSEDALIESALRVVRERDEYKRKYEDAMARLRKLESIFN